MTPDERYAYANERRLIAEKEISTEELILRMERNANIVIRMFPREKAREVIEEMLQVAQISGEWHSGFPEACLAMAARLDELLNK